MKKTISIILCMAMILSSVAFCLPAVAANVDFGVELPEDFAAATEDSQAALSASAVTIVSYDFEDGVNPFTVAPSASYVTTEIVDVDGGKALAVTMHKGTAVVNKLKLALDDALPAGRYQVSFDLTLPEPITDAGREMVTFYQIGTAATGLKQIGSTVLTQKTGKISATWDFDEETSGVSSVLSLRRVTSDVETYYIDNFKIEKIPVTGTLVFNANGGTGTQEPISAEVDDTVELPAESTFTRQYYSFKGWGRTSSATVNDLVSSYTVVKSDFDANSSVTFYAVWERNKYNVVLDLAGGNGDVQLTYTANEGDNCVITLPLSSDVKKTGYLLTGWEDADGNVYKPGKSVTLTEAGTITAVWLDLAGFGEVEAVSVSGYDGKSTDVDPRYPGAYYVFDTELDPDTVSVGNLGISGVSSVEYIADAKTLVLYPQASAARVGATFTIPAVQTAIMTADGESIVSLSEFSYTLAKTIPADGQNMLPYGDAEGGYFPYYTSNGSAYLEKVTEDGNTYAALYEKTAGNNYPHTEIKTYYDDGATYLFTGRFKSLGIAGSTSLGSTLNFNVSFNGTISSNPPLRQHDNGWNHIAEIGKSADWKSIQYEFTVTRDSGNRGHLVTIYSNPSDSHITQYAVDDFEMYRRIDVSYDAGIYTQLKEGAEDPERTGRYLAGPGKTDTTEITIAEMPYEVKDERWYIDEEFPWKDQYGYGYVPGETVDLAETGEIALTPNVKTDYKVYTVSFAGDVTVLPEPALVLEGDTFDVSYFNNRTPIDTTKRFNGWSVDGTPAGICAAPFTVTEDITLTAVVNYDYNFSLSTSTLGWSYNGGTVSVQNGMLYCPNTKNANDNMLSNSSVRVPLEKYKGIVMVFGEDYSVGDEPKKLEVGTSTEGIFFSRVGESASASRQVGAKISEMIEDPAGNIYAVAYYNGYQNGYWTGTLGQIRFDMPNGYWSYSVRYIHFLEADELEDAEIAITGIDAPQAGKFPDTTATEASGLGTIQSITWTPDNLVKDRFTEKTAYTVSIDLIATARNACYGASTTATVNGNPADITVDPETGVATVTYTFPETPAYLLYEMAITGPETINRSGRAQQYNLSFTNSEVPIKTAEWSVDDPTIAEIVADTGYLVPIKNGTVVITANSNYNPAISATFTVEIVNQSEPAWLTYDPATTDPVTNMPEPVLTSGVVELSKQIPQRAGYNFLGWATSDETLDTVSTVSVKEDVTVYAVWSKGIFFNFGKNGTAKMNVGTGYVQGDNYDQFTATVRDHRATLSLASNNVDPDRYRTVIVRLAADQAVPTQIYYKSVYLADDGETEVQIGYDTNGFRYAEAQSLRYNTSFTGLDDFRTVTFDFYNNDKSNSPGAWKDGKAERIITIYVDPAKKAGATVRLQYIALLDTQRDITFDANTTDTVTGMPENTVTAQGDVLNIAETPVREGYKFVGWSKSPTERKTVKTSFTIVDDTTFYAVWDQTVSGEPVVEDGKAIYAISEISDTVEALLVKAGSAAGNSVSFTYTDAEGNAQRISAVTNGVGYAVIDITAVEGTITDAAVVLSADIASPEITLTDLATATTIANTVPAGGNSNVSTGSGSSGSGGNYNYDKTVKDVVNDGEQYTVGATGGSGDTKSVLAESKSEEDILFNFDETYEKDFFNSYRQITLDAMADSVMTLTSKGLAAGSNDSPAAFTSTIALDADSHRYIVVKAKQSGLSGPNLRVYFQKEGLGFSQANSIAKPMTEQYSMLVYDMKEFADWTGTVNRLFFSLDGNVLGTFDIDWILFTDTVPESMDDIAGAREIFPVVNEGAIPFTDVTSGEWFYNEVAQAYKLGFVEGTSATTYEPDGSVTIAEAITLAVRLNYIYNQKTLPKAAEGAEWYKPFVDAAVRAGIIKNTQFAEYDVPALRKEVASIMAKALPSDFYAKINMFTSIPDMAKTDANYSAVLKLYNAGILNGSDEAYNFYPDTNITRAEIAAIVNRIAVAKNRKRIVTQEEIESRKIRYYADDIVASATLGNCTAGKMTLKNGLAYGTGKAGDNGRSDPIVYLTNVLGSLNGKEISKITVGMKWNASETNAAALIYFTTPTGGWAAERMLASTKGETHEDGVVDFVFDTSKNGQFANTITGLRFDPFDAPYEFAIAYVIIE